jgi:hypothetical protein
MKKRFFFSFLTLIGLPLVALGGFQVDLLWPRFFPKYPVGSCVEDTDVHRIHEITGYDDRFKGSGVPTRIVKRGTAAPGTYPEGSEGRIEVTDPAIRPVRCP